MSTRARKERKALQRNLRLFGQRSAAAALWEPEAKVPTGHYEKAADITLEEWARSLA